MIYTITFNPAIDYIMNVESMEPGITNRSKHEEIYFGGKGINVSCVLRELDIDSVALGFCAGFTGDALVDNLMNKGIKSDFIKLKKGNTRINVKIKSDAETEINGNGPEIASEELDLLYKKLLGLKSGDILVLAGSIPNSLPETIYEDIMKIMEDKNVKTVVDATGNLLVNVLKYKPFLIKPNNYELGDIFGIDLKSDDDITKYALKLHDSGAQNVLVSMADKGAILVDETGKVHKIIPPSGKAVNSVGAGDSMVAGFIAGYLETGDYAYALKLGTAAGSATAFSAELATKYEIIKTANSF